jgi:hypothetical protein
MVNIYKINKEKSFSNYQIKGVNTGTTFFSNKEGKTVLVESWSTTSSGVNPSDNLEYFISTSNLNIQNISKLNGTYISNYVFNENVLTKKQKKLVVYYVGVTNKCRIKVTYIDNWNSVMIEYTK